MRTHPSLGVCKKVGVVIRARSGNSGIERWVPQLLLRALFFIPEIPLLALFLLWKFFKKEILYNTYYEKFEDFVLACKNFFRCRTKYREKLRSLLTQKFHLYKNV